MHLLVTLLAILSAAGARAQAPADTVLVSYREILGEIGDGDRGPSLQVFGDGRIQVHYPRYMKRAGDYTAQLGAAELDRLLASLAEKGVTSFDETNARRARREAAAARRGTGPVAEATGSVVLDASTSVIELDVGGGRRSVSWSGLQEDARSYPEIAPIANLARAEAELRQLMKRSDLRRTDGSRP